MQRSSTETLVVALLLRVEHQEDEVEAREQRVRQLDILDDRLVAIPLRLHRVRSGQHRSASVQLANDPCTEHKQNIMGN